MSISAQPPHVRAPTLHLVGASVRAVAQSAYRAGWNPMAWDLFADADLQAFCPAKRVDWRGADFLKEWAEQPSSPWMFTGPLENQAELVGLLSQGRELLGNGPDVLIEVRNPFRLHQVLTSEGFLAPTLSALRDTPQHGTWVLKPFLSGGGFGMQLCPEPAKQRVWKMWLDKERKAKPEARFYWQEFVPGKPCSAVYVGSRQTTMLLGATQQLLGTPPRCDSPFRYLGSLGPLRLSRLRDELQGLGETLTRRFKLRGIFGVDFIRQGNRAIPIEVNPRYPASCEILERALGVNALSWHVAACRDEPLLPRANASLRTEASLPPHYVGKAIVYARHPVWISKHCSQRLVQKNLRAPWPRLGDIPPADEQIALGCPILTIFRQANSWSELRTQFRWMCHDPVAKTGFRLGRENRI